MVRGAGSRSETEGLNTITATLSYIVAPLRLAYARHLPPQVRGGLRTPLRKPCTEAMHRPLRPPPCVIPAGASPCPTPTPLRPRSEFVAIANAIASLTPLSSLLTPHCASPCPTADALRNLTGRCGHRPLRPPPCVIPAGASPCPTNRRPYARAANFSHRASEASFLISSLLTPHSSLLTSPPSHRTKKAGGIPPPAQQTSQVASDPDQSSRYLSS